MKRFLQSGLALLLLAVSPLLLAESTAISIAPVKTLKIDRTFVSKLTESESNARVVQAIIALGKALDLQIVAEGVETDQQYAKVRKLGCDLVQGYFIARPMSATQLRAWCGGYEDTQSLKHGSTVVGIDKARQ